MSLGDAYSDRFREDKAKLRKMAEELLGSDYKPSSPFPIARIIEETWRIAYEQGVKDGELYER